MSDPRAAHPRALLFDLDDTLFDCHGQLVRPAHEEAVAAMIAAGLPAGPEEALGRRLALFAERPREDVNRLLAEAYGAPRPEVIEAGYDAFHRREVGPIEPFPGVHETLAALGARWRLFLVTSGDPATQRRKIDRLRLADAFEAIALVDPARGETKEDAFRRILEETRLAPAACVAVGNRIDSEIRAGRSLGLGTVWLRHGEYAHVEPEDPAETPDRIIDAFGDLPGALESLFPMDRR